MSLIAFGINHKTAPVDIRERVSFAPESLDTALRELVNQSSIYEAAILSTCNRTEVYCGLETHQAISDLTAWFSDFHKVGKADLNPYIYNHPDQEAVRHMLRVASGLDSMVLGEPQILGQMKTAYHTAQQAGTLGKYLSRLFQHTFSVAKQVRTDTAIGSSPVSVAFAAVSLAKQIFGSLENQTTLLIGAGETIELAARHLHENGIGKMIIANRTAERAHQLASELHAYAIALEEIPDHLAEADIIISSTASPLPILGKGSVERALKLRKHRPMFMVDIAVPRDIEPEVDQLDDVYLYSVDDLQEIIQENLKSREDAAQQAHEIIDTQVSHFMGWLKSLDAVNSIRQLRDNANSIREEVLQKAIQRLNNGDNPQEVIDELARLLTNKLIHTPSVQMQQAGYEGDKDVLEVLQTLYLNNPTDRA